MIPAFPKIFHLGDKFIDKIFDGPVEITEKIDGSQFVFGKIGGELFCRSKGKMLVLGAPEKMFEKAIDYVMSVQESIPNNIVFFCEYLRQPKHNVLAYHRIPTNGLALFGVCELPNKFISEYSRLIFAKNTLGIDVVPLIYEGEIKTKDDLVEMLDTDSYLGNVKIEGIVIKNYTQPFMIRDRVFPLMSGKFVSEKFKEKHRTDWKVKNTGKGRWDTYVEGFRTDARWEKAVQHLRDNGELENAPRDIGKLIKEIHRDITEEEKENIKDVLWKEFGIQVLRKSTAGFPEWYKKRLAENMFR